MAAMMLLLRTAGMAATASVLVVFCAFTPGCGDDDEPTLAELSDSELAAACARTGALLAADEQAKQGTCKLWAALNGFQDKPDMQSSAPIGAARCEALLPQCPGVPPPRCARGFHANDCGPPGSARAVYCELLQANCKATVADLQACADAERATLRSYAPLSCDDVWRRVTPGARHPQPPAEREQTACSRVDTCFPIDFDADGAAGSRP